MIIPKKGTYLAEIVSRTKQLPSGLFLADKIKDEKNDNVAKCLGVGGPAIKSCYLCHDKRMCKKKCKDKGKLVPIAARRTDILHFKQNFGRKFNYEGRQLISLTNNDLIAIEREDKILAVGSMVIVKLVRKEGVGSIILSDGAQVSEGEFHGQVVSVGPDFPDKSLKIGDRLLYERDEGYRFIGFNDRQDYLAIKSIWCGGVER